MSPEELADTLRPLYGRMIDRLWTSYVAGDREGKERIVRCLELLKIQSLGFDSGHILLPPPSETSARGAYPVGRVRYADQALYPFGLREEEWIQHIAIFGRSGSGKTNVSFTLLKSLLARNRPFLIFDWKRNYRDLIAEHPNIRIYTPGRPLAPFRFNPLIPPPGVHPISWLKKLIEVLNHAYFAGEGVAHILQEGIHRIYKHTNFYQGGSLIPTMRLVKDYLETQPVRNRRAQWMDSALRVLSSLCFGEMGKIINTTQTTPLEELLRENVVLELEALPSADKTFLTEALLLWIHHYRLQESEREVFKHAIFIEEAHHILLKKKFEQQGSETITETILREIRELGEAIVVIDQHPSLISLPALGNSHTTICLNLKHQLDVACVGAAMLVDRREQEVFGRLGVGEAIVKLQSRHTSPFLIDVPHQLVRKGCVSDELVARSRRSIPERVPEVSSVDVLAFSTPANEVVSADERAFLQDVVDYPFSSVRARYKRLGLSGYRGTKIQQALLSNRLLAGLTVTTREGQRKLLELTPAGALVVGSVKSSEGVVHRFWKERIAEYLTSQGFAVEVEALLSGHRVDVLARKDYVIAIEVETGKSDYEQNVRHLLAVGVDRIVVAVTTREAGRAIRSALEAAGLLHLDRVFVILARDFA